MTFQEWWESDWGKDTVPPNQMQDFKDALMDAWEAAYQQGFLEGSMEPD